MGAGEADRVFEGLGFVRSIDGRHWTFPQSEIHVETPSGGLERNVLVHKIEVSPGRVANVLSLVDIVVFRLEEFQAGGHPEVGVQPLTLLGHLQSPDHVRLEVRAKEARVTNALRSMSRLASEIEAGSRPFPESYEYHEIAQDAMKAEYS